MARGQTNRLRLIGGSHRGRWLDFPDAEGLRPTADRIRETLFNWLQPMIVGASCLDLFAGTGALGFEAASRGATRVLMLEQNPRVFAVLQDNRQRLGLEAVTLIPGEALTWMATRPEAAARPTPFDLILLDPPFQTRLLEESLALLGQGASELAAWLKPEGLIYLEQQAARPWPELPRGLTWYRQKEAGQVRYGLAKRSG